MKRLTQKRHSTSASNILQRKLCPGSDRMEAGIAEVESEFSAEGTMLHELFMSGIRRTDLKPEQIEALDTAERDAGAFFETFRATCGIPEDADFTDSREIEMWLTNGAGYVLFPGHADIIRVWPQYDAAAVVDAKFGFMEVDEAADNLQLASYAAMQAQRWEGLENIGVCIVQPRNFGPRKSHAIYSRQAIVRATVEIVSIYDATQDADAPLVAGAVQCHFCKAKAICPAYTDSIAFAHTAHLTAAESLSNDQLERLLTAVQFADKISRDVKAEAKRRIERGEFPGYALQNTGDTKTLKDPVGLYDAMRSYFHDKPAFTATLFDDCRTMTWGKLSEAVQGITGTSEKKAKELIEELSAPFVERTPKDKRIVKEKAKALK